MILPQLLPVTIFLLVWQTLLSLQLFDLVYATTRGGPLDSTAVIVYYVYNQAFQLFNAGYAAAVAYASPRRCSSSASPRPCTVAARSAGRSAVARPRLPPQRRHRREPRLAASTPGTWCWRRSRCCSRCRCSGCC